MNQKLNARVVRYFTKHGMTVAEIADRCDVSRQYVHMILNTEGVDTSRSRRRNMLRRELELFAAYRRINDGRSRLRDEARALDISPDWLREDLRDREWYLIRGAAPLHGTRYRYSQGCRCDACREAQNSYQKRYRGKEPPSHGLSGYTNYGCRCAVCRAAGRLAAKRYYQKQKERKSRELQRANAGSR